MNILEIRAAIQALYAAFPEEAGLEAHVERNGQLVRVFLEQEITYTGRSRSREYDGLECSKISEHGHVWVGKMNKESLVYFLEDCVHQLRALIKEQAESYIKEWEDARHAATHD